MNYPIRFFAISSLAAGVTLAQQSGSANSASAAAPVAGTVNAAKLSATELPPADLGFELPRFKSHHAPGDAPSLARSKVTVDDLSASGILGARKKATKQNVTYLSVPPRQAFATTLRGKPKDILFVSFLVYGSDGTTIDVAGAKLSIAPAAVKAGYGQLSVAQTTAQGITLQPIGEMALFELHDGANVASLPWITLRIDPGAGIWDLYHSNRLVLSDLPLTKSPGVSPKTFSLTAGKEGAMICSLVSSDENPLFVDANNNGIDDDFEKAARRTLLDADLNPAERTKLAGEWKAYQAAAGVKPWAIRRPLPDGKQ